jgi:hypothetical protein
MAFPLSVVFGFITKPLTMIRLFAELFGHYQNELVLVGGRVAFAAESFGDQAIRTALQTVGGRLMQQGLKTSQTMSSRQSIPVAEQV